MVAKKTKEIPDSKIRVVIWKLEKTKATKKECCEYLGINYNTTRLTNIVKDFRDREKREKDLKEKAKKKVFSKGEIKSIIEDYTNDGTISGIAKNYYVSFPRIKKILIEHNVPIRSRGHKKSADVTHIKQDLDIKFSIGEKVFIPGPNIDEYINKNKALIQPNNTYGEITKVFDEEYLEKISNGYMKDKQLPTWDKLKEDQIPRLGVHFETYWHLENGILWGKMSAFKDHINQIENHLANYGREYYRIWINNNKYNGFYTFNRDEIFPVKGDNIEI